ncbi:MAG: membrane protein insertase YidC [Chthonomonas sp.]|nr:membrane protein insertase YidC [Chthonomonas sp.]
MIGTFLWMGLILLGFQLFTNARKPLPDSRTSAEILTEIKKFSTRLDQSSVDTLVPLYEQKVQEELTKAGKTTLEINQAKLVGDVIQGETLLRAAQSKAPSMRPVLLLERAYNPMHGKERAYKNSEAWTTPVDLAPDAEGSTVKRTMSPKQLFDSIKIELDKLYKTDYVWGLVQGYQFIDTLVSLTGRVPSFSYAFAALLLAICVRAIIWPLAQRQLMWSRQMTQLQPLVKELEEAYKKKDPSGAYKSTPEYQQKMMQMYQEYGINPLKGCLPALAQMPLFLFVYSCMLHYRFAFSNGTFLWINPSSSAGSGGFFSPSLGEPDTLLLIVYGISMIASTMLAPVTDPNQVKQQRSIGIAVALIFTAFMYFGFPVPSAFVLYWICTNVLSALQSYRAYRLPMPPLTKKNAPGGGVVPISASPTKHTNGVAKTGPKPQKPSQKAK